MELQLGLSLHPSATNTIINNNPNPPIIEGFDHPSPFFLISSLNHNTTNNFHVMNKRSFSQAFLDSPNRPPPKTLALLWNDDDSNNNNNNAFSLVKNESEDEDGVVGWPPIKLKKKRLCCGGSSEGNRTVENGCGCGERVSKFMYVKIKMEGVGIARKVDLSVHACFDTLINTLMNMFGKCHEDSENYKLTYQDRDGDWLLAQDVSWRTFIRSVQRLKLLRRNH